MTKTTSINHEQEEKTNGAYGNRSHGEYKSDTEDMIRDGRFLDTPDRRGDRHGYYSSYGPNRTYDHHHYHPYRRSEKGYFLDDLKKEKPPTFDGEMKKLEDEAWLFGLKKFF